MPKKKPPMTFAEEPGGGPFGRVLGGDPPPGFAGSPDAAYVPSKSGDGWIGVDLDHTLATYNSRMWPAIGEPIPPMMDRVRAWVEAGIEVRIVTARAGEGPAACRQVQDWLERHGLPRLQVTDRKDFRMLQLWDDRAVRVERGTGRILGDEGLEVHDRMRRT